MLRAGIYSICLLEEFSIYLNYVRKLGFEEPPDYEFLRDLFAKVIKNMGEVDDQRYDWNELNGGKGWESQMVVSLCYDSDGVSLTFCAISVERLDFKSARQKARTGSCAPRGRAVTTRFGATPFSARTHPTLSCLGPTRLEAAQRAWGLMAGVQGTGAVTPQSAAAQVGVPAPGMVGRRMSMQPSHPYANVPNSREDTTYTRDGYGNVSPAPPVETNVRARGNGVGGYDGQQQGIDGQQLDEPPQPSLIKRILTCQC